MPSKTENPAPAPVDDDFGGALDMLARRIRAPTTQQNTCGEWVVAECSPRATVQEWRFRHGPHPEQIKKHRWIDTIKAIQARNLLFSKQSPFPE